MRLAYCPYSLKFNEPAGTSRGILTEKLTCFLKLWDEQNPDVCGFGEAAVFPGLSPEANETFELKIVELLANIALGQATDLSRHSSIQFGLEQAILDLSNGGKSILYPSQFTEKQRDIVINGLIWMGDFRKMEERVCNKLQEDFHCIKIKVGAIDWQEELKLIRSIRNLSAGRNITIRVDANGGFSMDNCLARLKVMADLGVHSIEQPIPAGNEDLMKFLCEVSPLPIALDEELIGKNPFSEGAALLDYIKPQYIILKPALCGGFSGARKWIDLAEERGIGWWITSALESSVGLNAIAQFTGSLDVEIPQGLGTGSLFTNNFISPLTLKGEILSFNGDCSPMRSQLMNLPWRE